MARIYGTQKALSNNPNSSLICLENQLLNELDTILDQDCDLWMLKSKLNWMIQGDRNTSFYHVSTLTQRKRNHIAVVKDERESWLTEEREVMEHFRAGFHTLYTTAQEMVFWNPLVWISGMFSFQRRKSNRLPWFPLKKLRRHFSP